MHDDQRCISFIVLRTKQFRITEHDALHRISHTNGCCEVRQHKDTPRGMAVGLVMNHMRLDDRQRLIRVCGQIRSLAQQQEHLEPEASDKQKSGSQRLCPFTWRKRYSARTRDTYANTSGDEYRSPRFSTTAGPAL